MPGRESPGGLTAVCGAKLPADHLPTPEAVRRRRGDVCRRVASVQNPGGEEGSEELKNQRFGIEIEMTGITRSAAAKIIAKHFGTEASHVGGSYDTYTISDGTERRWKVVSDSSIRCQARGERTASKLYAVEVVSPICQYEDIETVQELIRELRKGGARVNDSCGIHIHVDASRHDPKTLRNVVNIMASKEDLLYKTLKVKIDRQYYCQKTDLRFLEDVNLRRPKSMSEFETLWYNGDSGRHSHYHSSRYHALNLHSVFSKGTIEFRMFNSTLHAGEVKSYIQLCLAISNQALVQKSASRSRTQSSNEKYTFRTWLLRLGMIGEEFKTARQHLLKNLDGNIAWKDPAQAQQQRERQLRQRLEQQAGVSPSAVGAELAEQQAVQEADDLQMQEPVLSM